MEAVVRETVVDFWHVGRLPPRARTTPIVVFSRDVRHHVHESAWFPTWLSQFLYRVVVRECSICHYVELSMLVVMRLFVVWCFFRSFLFRARV